MPSKVWYSEALLGDGIRATRPDRLPDDDSRCASANMLAAAYRKAKVKKN